MLQKVLMLVLVLASIAGCVACGNTASHYVYATIPVANQVAAFREDPNSGVLTELAGSPYSVGDGARSIVIHPSGKYVYVANPGEGANGEDDISLFDVGSDGGLMEQPPRTPLGATATLPQLLLMDPAGNYLYSMNAGSSNISVFAINATGSANCVSNVPGCLTEVPNSPFGIGLTPLNMQLTPAGSFLYVTLASEPDGAIAAFSVNAGQLSLVSVTSSDGINPYGLAINSSGTYLYAGNNAGISSSIAVFAIGASGVLTEVAQSPVNDGYSDPVAMAFDPSGQFLYVADQGSSNIAAFSIASTGLPAALNPTNATNAFGAEANPSFIAFDPAGKYMFLGNQGSSAGIQAFEISSGSLTILNVYNVGNTPSSIAVLQ
jgi:6-phosphogluconolactonase